MRWFRASGPRSSTPLSRAWSRAQRASRPPPEDRRAVARWVARQHASARRVAADLQPAGAARKAGRSRRCPARPTPPPVVCPGGSGRARTLAIESIALSSPPPLPSCRSSSAVLNGAKGPFGGVLPPGRRCLLTRDSGQLASSRSLCAFLRHGACRRLRRFGRRIDGATLAPMHLVSLIL